MPENHIAVIDIGSNAVRLVVYDRLDRAPFKIHSERAICNLGADLTKTGLLNPDSVKKAMDVLHRISGLLSEMKVKNKNIRAVATAALRDARDGKAFIDAVRKECGLKIRVIDGGEEARLAALGVLAGSPGASGIVGDYGGGSLELIFMENGRVRHKASLPLGSHRLLAEEGHAAQLRKIDMYLERAGFLKKCKGKNFYAMGGAWRSMATAHMRMSSYPLQLLDHYQIEGKEAADVAAFIAQQSSSVLEIKTGMPANRVKDMAVAALVMEHLFKKIQPKRLIFSGTNIREGILYDDLQPAVQKQDALIVSCKKIALMTGCDDPDMLGKLFLKIKPSFKGQDETFMRLLRASCFLSDISRLEHEDYRAENALRRVPVLPFYGIDHAGRAFLALSQYVRYGGDPEDEAAAPMQRLMDKKLTGLAVKAGLSLRRLYEL